jgi:hypothetical protein
MAQNIYILSAPNNQQNEDYITDQLFINGTYISENFELTDSILIKMAKSCQVNYFYVIVANDQILFNYDFSFKPDEWDSKYVHIWNNDILLRLFNKNEVLKTPHMFTDKSFYNGTMPTKNINDKIYSVPLYDIVFLSYDELYAEENFNSLRNRFPNLKRIHGIKGIFDAHRTASKIVNTNMFYVVDADAIILNTFRFDYINSDNNAVCIWNSQNPINDLVYGYGGVKLFPTKVLLNDINDSVDFTTSISKNVKVIPEISNITKFNVNPFSTWRSAFRECTKLSSKIIINQNNNETNERLDVWCTVGKEREFGEYAIKGAIAGRSYGQENKNDIAALKLINDFSWLKNKFLT